MRIVRGGKFEMPSPANDSRPSDVRQFRGGVRDALDGLTTLFDTIFETADDAIFLMDGARIVDCNPATLRMFGCTSKAEVVGQTPIAFSPAVQPDGSASAEHARRYIEAALAGASQDFEWRHRRLDRSEFDVEVKLHRCFVGGAPFVMAVVRDTTIQKRIATTLLESKLFSDSLIDSLPGFFYLFDSNLRLVRWNKLRLEVLGYDEDDLRERSLESFLGPQVNRHEVMGLARNILDGRAPTTFVEAQLVRKDGALVWYLCSAARISSPSGPMLVGVGFDINEQKRALMERDRLLAECRSDKRAS
jgi:PAS domain S-box-containing protein